MSTDADAADLDARTAFYAAADAWTPHVTVETRWGLFLVHTADDAVGRKLFVRRSRTEIKMLRRVVEVLGRLGSRLDGTTFVDVGANIGTTAVPALTSLPFGGVVAVEPEPENLRVLRANLALNGVTTRAAVVEAAASDQVGAAPLVLDRRNRGAHELGRDVGNGTISVPTVTLDELARRRVIRPRRVGLLWLDVQGHEGHVLAGADSLTRRGVPVVLELYREGLERSRGLERILEVATARYSHFIEARSLPAEDARRAARPVSDLAELAAATANTDVLLVRLT